MKLWKTMLISGTSLLMATKEAFAQYGGVGGDQISLTLSRTISWLQITAISILGIYVIFNLMRMGKDDDEGPRAKKHVITGLVAIAGVMMLKGIVQLIQNLTASTVQFNLGM